MFLAGYKPDPYGPTPDPGYKPDRYGDPDLSPTLPGYKSDPYAAGPEAFDWAVA